MKKLKIPIGILVLAVVTSLIGEGLVRSGMVPSYLLPAPSQILGSLIEDHDAFIQAFFSTLVGAGSGFIVAAALGIGTACLLSLMGDLAEILLPVFLFFQTVPIVAIAPLMVIWFGFGRPTVVASSAIVSFFPVLGNSLLGLRTVPVARLELAQLLRVTPLQRLFRIQLPSSVSAIFAGLEISVGLAIIGAIVGEFVGGGGLGGLIDSARTQQKIEMVFAAVLLSALMGVLGVGIVRLLKQVFKKYCF